MHPNPTTSTEFLKAAAAGTCDMLPNVTDLTHTMTFTVNKSDVGYHYVAVSPLPSHVLDTLQVNVTGIRKYYNLSDLHDHQVPCSLSDVTSTCKINSSHSQDTCVLLQAVKKEEGNDFSAINIEADPQHLTRSSVFLAVITTVVVVSTLLLIGIGTAIAVIFTCQLKLYYYIGVD